MEVIHVLRLKQALDARGMSLSGSAELLGMSTKTLYNKMTGASDFTYGEVKKLRVLLPEYNIDFLLTEAPEDQPQDSA